MLLLDGIQTFSFLFRAPSMIHQVVSFVCESERRGEEKKAWYPFYFDTVIVIVVRSLYHTFEAKRYLRDSLKNLLENFILTKLSRFI